jgi:hypothetical protein
MEHREGQDDGYIRCEKLACRMSAATCVARQAENAAKVEESGRRCSQGNAPPVEDKGPAGASCGAIAPAIAGETVREVEGGMPATTAGEMALGALEVWPAKGSALIAIAFAGEADLALYERIMAEARRCRRQPDQQLLWMLQEHLDRLDDILRAGGR